MVKKEVAPIKFFTTKFFDDWTEIYVYAYKTPSTRKTNKYTRMIDAGKTIIHGGKIRWMWSYDYSYNTSQTIAKKMNEWMADFRREYPNAEFTILCQKINYPSERKKPSDYITSMQFLFTKDNKTFGQYLKTKDGKVFIDKNYF